MSKVGPARGKLDSSRGSTAGSIMVPKSKGIFGGELEIGSTSRSYSKKPKRSHVAEFQKSLSRSISKLNGGVKKLPRSKLRVNTKNCREVLRKEMLFEKEVPFNYTDKIQKGQDARADIKTCPPDNELEVDTSSYNDELQVKHVDAMMKEVGVEDTVVN